MDVLFLCTGNICRSPMAEGLMRTRLATSIEAAHVSSAGILYDGREASPDGVEAMRQRGIDISGHRSRKMTPEMLGQADVILAMARMHVREAAVMERRAFARMFTLKELVHRGSSLPPMTGETLEGWLARVAAERRPHDLLGESLVDDVADPIGRSFPFYERTAADLADLVDRVALLLEHFVTPVPQERTA